MLNDDDSPVLRYQLVALRGVGENETQEVLDQDRDLERLYAVRDQMQQEPAQSLTRLRYAVRPA